MNPGVVRLDQIMSKFLAFSEHRLQSLLLHFALRKANVIIDQLQLLMSAMSSSSKPITFAHFQKLTNQSTLNCTHVIEITKACNLMKARDSSFFFYVDRNVS